MVDLILNYLTYSYQTGAQSSIFPCRFSQQQRDAAKKLKNILSYQCSAIIDSKMTDNNAVGTTRKFFIRRNNNKVDFIETGLIVIADLLSWRNLENVTPRIWHHAFWINHNKIISSLLIYKYNFTFSLYWTTHKLTNDPKII